jgi:hypothetical protein
LAALVLFPRQRPHNPISTNRVDFAVFVLPYLPSVIAMMLVGHFAFRDSSLSLPYYTIYLVPGSVLALLMIGGEAEHRGGRTFGAVAVYCGIGVILLSWLARPVLPDTGLGSSFYSWLTLAAMTVGAALASYRAAAASVVLVSSAALLMLSLYQLKNPRLNSLAAWAAGFQSSNAYDIRNRSQGSEAE